MSIKKVTRTYKTASGMVTKTYEYDAGRYAKRKGRKLVTVSESGKVSVKKSNIEKVKKEIKANDGYTEEEKEFLIQDLENLVETRAEKGKSLTSNGFYSRYESDPVDRMFANMGLGIDEAAKQLGVSEEELRTQENWSGSTFMNPSSNKAVDIVFTYTGRFYTA